jgi:hypothetical protein
MVLLITVVSVASLCTPPPFNVAVLPDTVLLVRVSDDGSVSLPPFIIPPPLRAELPEMVLFVMVSLLAFNSPPPLLVLAAPPVTLVR